MISIICQPIVSTKVFAEFKNIANDIILSKSHFPKCSKFYFLFNFCDIRVKCFAFLKRYIFFDVTTKIIC